MPVSGRVTRTGAGSARRRRLIIAVTAFAVVLGLGSAAILGFRSWLNTQWYVGSTNSARGAVVGIYQGVPQELFGLHLAALISASSVELVTLPAFDQELLVRTIPASSRADAERIVEQMRQTAMQCLGPTPPTGCPVSAA